jgi:TonB family protein
MVVMSGRGSVLLLLLLVLFTTVGTAAAQDPLTKAKALYHNAAYQDALTVLAGEEASLEVHQYRTLCLLALGQVAAAQREIAIIVATDPFFVPDSTEFPPRLIAMFKETRRGLLPEAVQRAFNEAKILYRDGALERARKRFDDVRRLLDDAAISDDAELKSMRLVVDGYSDLLSPVSTASPAAPAAPSAPTTDSKVLAAGPPAAAVARTSAVSTPQVVIKSTPPVVINQTLPQWRPTNDASATRAYSGAVKVTISAEGRVTSAVMQRRIHPLYDRAVMEAATRWSYRPATLDGKPVTSEKTVEIELAPRN